MIVLSVAANGEHELEFGSGGEQAVVPMTHTFRPRGLVRSALGVPREAESHRDDGKTAFVVKLVPRNTEPFPQAIAGAIVIWSSAAVDPPPRRLAGNANPRHWADPQYRSDAVRELCGADRAGTDLRHEIVEVSGGGTVMDRQ